MSSAPGGQRYFFVIEGDEHDHSDVEGTILSDHDAARAYAERIIGELKEGGGYGGHSLTMIIMDADGEPVLSIPFWSVIGREGPPN